MKRLTSWCLAAVVLTAASGRIAAADGNPNDWPMYGHDIQRTAFNANETKINRSSVGLLRLKWAFHADDAITASPVVINFEHFGPNGTEPPRKVVYVGSADENFYAIDASDGSQAWPQPFKADPAPSIAYNMFVSSAFVDLGRKQLYVGGGFTMYALDLFTGAVKWKWSTAQNGGGEIESSPVMIDGAVYFGSDQDGAIPTANPKYPAVFALDADSGALRWFFRPNKRPEQTCGSVWGSPAVDAGEGLLYFATADCTRSHQDLYNESIIALPITPGSLNSTTLERTDLPNWYYQPRDIDAYDYDFGASPLLFDAGGKKYLGIGGKDGFFYVIERQRWDITGGIRTPKWVTRVVRGGFAGGFIGSSATDGQKIYGATALLDTPPSPNPQLQPPFLHSFDALTGDVAWQQVTTGPTFGPTTAVPGVVFVGGVDGVIQALDADTGQLLWLFPAIGAVSSGGAVSDGELFIGAGTTATSYNLGQGPINALLAFTLLPGAPTAPMANVPPALPPIQWPLGVLQYPVPADENTPAPTPTPG